MTKIFIIWFFVLCTNQLFAQVKSDEQKDTVGKMVEGTYFKNGMMLLKRGYVAKLSADKSVLVIYLLTGGSPKPTGGYKCMCTGSGNCKVQSQGSPNICVADNSNPCTECLVYWDNAATGSFNSDKPGEGAIWKRLVLIDKSN